MNFSILDHLYKSGIALFVIFYGMADVVAQRQEFKFDKRIHYELVYQSDSTDSESKNTMMTELLLNDQLSLFRSAEKAYSDSILYDYLTKGVISFPPPQVIPMGVINPLNYQVLKKGDLIQFYDGVDGGNLNSQEELYVCNNSLADLKWTILTDTMQIAGFFCQKAEAYFGNRHWVAWFTRDIPVFDGPYKFAGLPGLIMQVEDRKSYWSFRFVALENIKKDVAINFKEGLFFRKSSMSDFLKKRRTYQRDSINRNLVGDGSVRRDRDEINNSIQKIVGTDNNWIESYL